MKPGGLSMDTSDPAEPTEVAAAESSVSQDNAVQQPASLPEQTQNDVSPADVTKTNGEPDHQVKLEAVASKKQPSTTKTQTSLRSKTQPCAAASHRPVNHAQSSTNNTNSGDKTAAKSSAAGAVPKRPVSVATVVPTVKTPTRVLHKRPAGSGPSRTASGATATSATNGTRPATLGGSRNKRTAADNVDAARVKSSAASRPAASTGHRPYTSVAAKVDSGAVPKTSRPASAPSSSRMATAASKAGSSTVATRAPTSAAAAASSGSRAVPSTSRAGNSVASKPPSSAGSRTAPSRVTTVPPAGRTAAAQPHPAAAVTGKKDVSRPPSTSVTKRPAAPSAATKKPEPSQPGATGKPPSTSKWAALPQKADPKVSQSKAQQPAKPASAKYYTAASPKAPAASKPPLGRTQHASPAHKSTNGSAAPVKHLTKPTQAVLPFTAGVKKTKDSRFNHSVRTQRDAGAAVTSATPAVQAAELIQSAPQEPSTGTSVPEMVPPQASTRDSPPEAEPQVTAQSNLAALSPPRSPVTPPFPEIQPPRQQSESDAPSAQLEQVATAVEVPSPRVASLPEIPSQSVNVTSDQTLSICKPVTTVVKSVTQVAPPSHLNDDEDEEEREGSQLWSVSEMSGTTQATEESRPGSAGLLSGSAWRVGGAVPSELDSLSGSQQGASELSAPGVLEGTESMDDLGEGSLKGAMEMEGASAGSPDFQKVPDIPFNDYDEDEDDEDRVCDMDVGSEKTDELQRHRHDNDVDDDEEDEDVEMASEAVTESGLESYGNADEDDFAEEERLDNLNRLVQLPPPPQLPSAPGAQWYQLNPFADPWEEQVQLPRLQQPLEPVSQPAPAEPAVSPLVAPLQADSETPSQSPAQACLETSSNPHVPENRDASSLSSTLKDGAKMGAGQRFAGPLQTPEPTSFPVSGESVTPEELGEGHAKIQEAPVTSPQPDAVAHMASGDQEFKAPTMPSDEVLRGVVSALTSNPSSTSITEDEASDTEGEALLEDSLESSAGLKNNITFEVQPPAQRGLSTVEEAEESEATGLTDDATPPSATSLASYGFDSATTASNAQSAGEGCIKSPGIFSLEELPEESKELCDQARSGLTEQQYIECANREVGCTQQEQGSEAPALNALQATEEKPEDAHPPYYSAICEKTDNTFTGLTPQHHHRHGDHRGITPRLTCADLPPRKAGQQALSPQLRRLEQHQRQLMEMQQRREQQSRPLEGAEQERKRTEEEEQRKKKDEAEEEIKRNEREAWEEIEEGEMGEGSGQSGTEEVINGEGKMSAEEEAERRELELRLLQQQSELKQRQQILQWQQELEEEQPPSNRAVVLSPSSGLCTIYEALENSDEEPDGRRADRSSRERRLSADLNNPKEISSNGGRSSPLDLDWGAKVDMVQQLINQTLLLNGDGCSSLLLLPGGAGGTLSPLESSLWPSLLPPISPPSATVTSVSSFSPEAAGSSPQGEWTVVELETHH
ncbi:protein piccolo [Hippocampus comes]|uniref:protein piccolo n=1 Tax=Hippocampus comes TaxID=109280 RepID=UPI00094E7DB8|nr:PREDICTED: protein piccolo-like [Hippocampus comes]XP_019718134.1 PREDICTED: protein piccolo-like [Hippocampus comes]